MMQKFKIKAGGFTLLELMVATGVFLIVITLGVGSVIKIFRSQRQLAALMAANANVSLVLEQMTREIRTGYNFCGLTLSCKENQLSFVNAYGDTVTYQLNDQEAIEKGVNGQFKRLTSDNVSVKYLTFVLQGNALFDGQQTKITISVGVGPKILEASEIVTKLQTSISPRVIDS